MNYNTLRIITRALLILFASFWFIFALLSGSDSFGGGLSGIIQNIPNALPWFLVFAFVYLAWKDELIGGIIISITGIFSVFFFHTYNSLISFSIISLPIIVLGGLLILYWCLTKKK